MKLKSKKGFTLIELLVVISIIGLLSSIVLSSVNSARKKAQLVAFMRSLNETVKAIEMYRLQFGHVPGEMVWDAGGGISSQGENKADIYSSGAGLMQEDFTDYFKQELVDNKFISSVPSMPTRFAYNGDIYITYFADVPMAFQKLVDNDYYTCGDKPIETAAIAISFNGTNDFKEVGNLKKLKLYGPDGTFVYESDNDFCIAI